MTQQEIITEGFKALIALVFGSAGTWFFMARQHRHEITTRKGDLDRAEARDEQDRLADHVRQMARHLTAMADAFSEQPKPRIPHTDGHAFEGLVEQLEVFFGSYLDKDQRIHLNHFRRSIEQATRLDENLLDFDNYDQLDEEARRKFKNWAIDARRLSGDLIVAAQRIKNGGRLKFDEVLRARKRSSIS